MWAVCVVPSLGSPMVQGHPRTAVEAVAGDSGNSTFRKEYKRNQHDGVERWCKFGQKN